MPIEGLPLAPRPTSVPTPPPQVLGQLDGQAIGYLAVAYQREAKQSSPRSVKQIEAVANFGLIGDQHAAGHSPRQVLIAGQSAYDSFGLPSATLRENLLITGSTVDLASGDVLQVGEDVQIWLTFACEPCSLLDRRSPGIMRAIGRHRGMLGRVIRGGLIREGDIVTRARAVLPKISEDWRARVRMVVCAIPSNRRVTYGHLAELAGVPKAYCRAFPRLLAQLPYEVACRVEAASKVLTAQLWNGEELFGPGSAFGVQGRPAPTQVLDTPQHEPNTPLQQRSLFTF